MPMRRPKWPRFRQNVMLRRWYGSPALLHADDKVGALAYLSIAR
jgi:hypothetical protein